MVILPVLAGQARKRSEESRRSSTDRSRCRGYRPESGQEEQKGPGTGSAAMLTHRAAQSRSTPSVRRCAVGDSNRPACDPGAVVHPRRFLPSLGREESRPLQAPLYSDSPLLSTFQGGTILGAFRGIEPRPDRFGSTPTSLRAVLNNGLRYGMTKTCQVDVGSLEQKCHERRAVVGRASSTLARSVVLYACSTWHGPGRASNLRPGTASVQDHRPEFIKGHAQHWNLFSSF